MFVKELKMYVDYLKNEIESISEEVTTKQTKKWEGFRSNLFNGIAYYQELFRDFMHFESTNIQNELLFFKEELMAVTIPVMKET